MACCPKALNFIAGTLCLFGLAASGVGQDKVQPEVTVDLRPLGAAADLFSAGSDSKYEQRGVASVFWLGSDRVAVGFSTTRRWSNSANPEPLHVRLVTFQALGAGAGKQLYARDWDFSGEGPAAESTLQFAPGPDDTILAAHTTVNSTGTVNKIPEGDFIQVLNQDTSQRQDFYVAATSAWVPSLSAEPNLMLETFYADKHTSISWWSGRPLKAGQKLDLPRGKEEITAGPGVAARAICGDATHCSGIRVFAAGADPVDQLAKPGSKRPGWYFSNPDLELVPIPQLFLNPTALLVELVDTNGKRVKWLVSHADGSATNMPELPRGLQITRATSISRDGQRFSVNAAKEVGLCGAFDLWCKEQGTILVVDVPSQKVIFQQEASAFGGISALSPDGRKLAVFDKDRLMIYGLP
jgi:hypothetical protein